MAEGSRYLRYGKSLSGAVFSESSVLPSINKYTLPFVALFNPFSLSLSLSCFFPEQRFELPLQHFQHFFLLQVYSFSSRAPIIRQRESSNWVFVPNDFFNCIQIQHYSTHTPNHHHAYSRLRCSPPCQELSLCSRAFPRCDGGDSRSDGQLCVGDCVDLCLATKGDSRHAQHCKRAMESPG